MSWMSSLCRPSQPTWRQLTMASHSAVKQLPAPCRRSGQAAGGGGGGSRRLRHLPQASFRRQARPAPHQRAPCCHSRAACPTFEAQQRAHAPAPPQAPHPSGGSSSSSSSSSSGGGGGGGGGSGGGSHLRVEAQQRAQAQERVLLLDVVPDAAQRAAPAASGRRQGRRALAHDGRADGAGAGPQGRRRRRCGLVGCTQQRPLAQHQRQQQQSRPRTRAPGRRARAAPAAPGTPTPAGPG